MTISITIAWWMPTLWLAIGTAAYLPAEYLIWRDAKRSIPEERLKAARLDTFRRALITRIGWRPALAGSELRRSTASHRRAPKSAALC